MDHVTVYREKGRFAGWPANYGIWNWGDEIVVGFTVGSLGKIAPGAFHLVDRSNPFVPMQARSIDGGMTWSTTKTPCETPGDRGFSADEHVDVSLKVSEALEGSPIPTEPPGSLRFDAPDFALMCGRTGLHAGSTSWYYASYDRCRSWMGPYWLPMFGQRGVSARTDYLINGTSDCLLFLSAAKPNGRDGRPFCVHTGDGGRTFSFLSWIAPEPEGHAIMPASVRLPDSRIAVAVRYRVGLHGWIDLYMSGDDGATWEYAGRPVPSTGRGNPPTLTLLQDGRLCITYGYRADPPGMCAVFSSDYGMTWGTETILRTDAGNYDIGYPRTVQRSDGKLVTAYYYNTHPEGERYIAATIWDAP